MIPIIDYGPYFAGAPEALEGVAADVAHACENVGFFYALNHGVSDDTIERAFAASRRFHALPLEQKLALRLDDNNIGYLPIDASIQGASAAHKATRPNQNESFFVTHDRGPDHSDVIAGKPLRGRNRWPPGLPGLRTDMMAPRRRGAEALQFCGPNDPQRRLGTAHDDHAAQSSDVGGDRHLHWARGQYLLAPPDGRAWWEGRSRLAQIRSASAMPSRSDRISSIR
jgi:hypothetical protein